VFNISPFKSLCVENVESFTFRFPNDFMAFRGPKAAVALVTELGNAALAVTQLKLFSIGFFVVFFFFPLLLPDLIFLLINALDSGSLEGE